MKYLFYFIGVVVIIFATDIGRNKDSELKLFSKDWWVQLLLLIIGINIINNVEL